MKEVSKAKAAFALYRDMGPTRSLAKVAKSEAGANLALSLRQLQRWSSAHNWVERVAQYDEERAEEQRRKAAADVEAMNQRQAQMGVVLQTKMLAQINKLLEADAFGSMATIQGLKLGLDVERIARGIPAERTGVEITGKDGTPLPVPGRVAVYLPQKNPPPETAIVDADDDTEE